MWCPVSGELLVVSIPDLCLLPYFNNCIFIYCTVKPVYNSHSKIDNTKILMVNGSLVKVESIGAFSNTFDLHLAIIGLSLAVLLYLFFIYLLLCMNKYFKINLAFVYASNTSLAHFFSMSLANEHGRIRKFRQRRGAGPDKSFKSSTYQYIATMIFHSGSRTPAPSPILDPPMMKLRKDVK